MNAATRFRGAAALGLAGWLLAGCTPGASPEAAPASSPSSARPEPLALSQPHETLPAAALEALAARVDALERQLRERSVSAAQPPTTAARPTEAQLREGPAGAVPRDPQQAEHERMTTLESQFQQEPANTAWASVSSAAVRQAVPPSIDSSALSVRDVTCRSKTCRVEVTATGQDTMRQALPLLAQRLADRFASMAVISHRDGTGATLYLRD